MRRARPFLLAMAVTGLGCNAAPDRSADGELGRQEATTAGLAGDAARPLRRCAGPGDPACGADQYCRSLRPGLCPGRAVPGICAARPQVCTDHYDPVCGCDGPTYGNACQAAAAGVAVAAQGECQPPVVECTSDAQCGDRQYCERPAGQCTASGVCAARPEACSDLWDPVCGCDGRTYSNGCDAAMAGVTVASPGECRSFCQFDFQCGKGQFCETPEGQCGGIGSCARRGGICPLFFDPVCGCDGVTYGNDCEARAAGASVASRGECGGRERCGGFAGDLCPAGKICIDDPTDDCDPLNGGADCGGICVGRGGGARRR
jgi:hypothetical protein